MTEVIDHRIIEMYSAKSPSLLPGRASDPLQGDPAGDGVFRFSGASRRGYEITVNADEPVERQNFSIAHEIVRAALGIRGVSRR
jgi:hypothetical protein